MVVAGGMRRWLNPVETCLISDEFHKDLEANGEVIMVKRSSNPLDTPGDSSSQATSCALNKSNCVDGFDFLKLTKN